MNAALRRSSPQGVRWCVVRADLPIAAVRESVTEALEKSDVVVVSGETGSGKTTQV